MNSIHFVINRLANIRKYFKQKGFSTRGIIFWDKMQPWENFSQFELAWTSFDKPAAMIRLSNTGGANKETKIHPTQKPKALYHWIYKKYANPGDKVLDTHLGSGSNRIVAFKMGFDFYATEIDVEYFKSQEKRFRRDIAGKRKIFFILRRPGDIFPAKMEPGRRRISVNFAWNSG